MTLAKKICGRILLRLRGLVDIRDVHVYGGILLLGVGLAAIDWRLGLAIAGCILFYLGVRKVK